MRCQPGSGSPFGRVRRSGNNRRSRASTSSGAARPLAQSALPVGCDGSGSSATSRPSSTTASHPQRETQSGQNAGMRRASSGMASTSRPAVWCGTVSVQCCTHNVAENAMTLQFGWWDHFEQRSDMPLWQQYDERIELIRHAEELGFYGYHIAEHHFTTLDMAPSPIVFLAAVARRTSEDPPGHDGAVPAAVSSDAADPGVLHDRPAFAWPVHAGRRPRRARPRARAVRQRHSRRCGKRTKRCWRSCNRG